MFLAALAVLAVFVVFMSVGASIFGVMGAVYGFIELGILAVSWNISDATPQERVSTFIICVVAMHIMLGIMWLAVWFLFFR